MANQYKNKVVYNGTTLIDLSDTTAMQSDVASGKYFYTASGERVAGTGQGSGTGNVDDVQINGKSIVSDGVATIPLADANNVGLMRVGYGLFYDNTDNRTNVSFASANAIKDGLNGVTALNPVRQHQSVFYGLAKASGDTTQSASSNAVGNYTDNAKDKIQTMLGVSPLIAPHESDPFESAHAIGELFIINGKLYRAKTTLTAGEYVNEGTNVEVVDVAGILDDYATKQEIENNINIVEKNNSGAIASFSDGADGMPMKSLVVDIDPVQSGSGDPSPDNVRPISGWTGVTVHRADGENLIPNKKVLSGNRIFFGTDVQSGDNTHSITLPVGTYTLSVETADGTTTNLYVAKVGVYEDIAFAYAAKSLTFTLAETTDCRLWAYKSEYSTVGVGAITQFQLELGSTATAYEPYNGSTYTIDWQTEAGTVYGGTLDVVSGVLTVDRIVERPTSVTGSQIDTYGRCYIYTTGQVALRKELDALAMCDMLATTTAATATFAVNQYGGAGAIYFISLDSTYDTVAKYDAWLAENKPTIVLWLATPITYQLTPTEVKSLLGQNHVWADCGDCSVEYFSQVDEDLVDYIKANLNSYAKKDLLNNYVKNTDYATYSTAGVVKVDSDWGIGIYDPAWSGGDYGNFLYLSPASSAQIKAGSTSYKAIVPNTQHESIFYGLAKASGDTTQSSSNNAVGTYTESAKSSISEMLNGSIAVSGTAPTIVAKAGIRYVCGEVLTLNITVPSTGIIDVVFTSGSSPTVLTITPPTGMTMKWSNDFDPAILEANATYEINIMDGCLGVVGIWT